MEFDLIDAGWRDCILGDVIELKRGYDLPKRFRKPGMFPIVSSSGPSGWHIEAKVSGPGVVTGRYGTIGRVFFIESDFWPLNTALYVRDFKGADPRFVAYFLRSVRWRKFTDKAAVPGVNRNHVHMEPVVWPPPPEQRRIAAVLGALDDKIELNRKMNQTLETMAQALFKSWFVDFDPVVDNALRAGKPIPKDLAEKAERRKAVMARESYEVLPFAGLFPDGFDETKNGSIPKGWISESLDSIAHFLNGAACQKYRPESGEESLPVIKIRELKQGITEKTDRATTKVPTKWVIHSGDVLFSWSGSLVVTLWTQGPGVLNQHLFKVTSEQYPRWLYYLWTKYHLRRFQRIAASKATTMGHIKRQHLSEAMCSVPSRDIVTRLDSYFAPLISKQLSSDLESGSLALLREVLLPKLISGEIRVPEFVGLLGERAQP